LLSAFSPDGELFEEERIITALQTRGLEIAEKILQGIEDELDTFVGDEEQSDDLTMLLLKREA